MVGRSGPQPAAPPTKGDEATTKGDEAPHDMRVVVKHLKEPVRCICRGVVDGAIRA
jgi:hypothetical protein